MKFTLSWLKNFLETDSTVDEISESLTSIGLEVEEVIDREKDLQYFEVAHIISVKPHPLADKLQICEVQTRDGTVQVVCGATNARANIKVVFARIGAQIPKGKFKIKESNIRGERSYGMLCSEEELLFASKSDGIIELQNDAVIGESISKYYGLDDPVFIINITPNRGDALSVYGIARDLAAKGIGRLRPLEIPKIKSNFFSKRKVIVNDKNGCSLFSFREIKNLQNKASPDWLKKLLQNINVQPISAIVDITNYISYSFGQPMHAYDSDKLKGDIVVDSVIASNDAVDFHALNNKNYLLQKNDLVVRDDQNIQALAGIIGAYGSSCDENTTNILLEAAYFNAKMVTATNRRLQIGTDSCHRFERKIDKNFTEKALELATSLLLSICKEADVSEIVVIGEKDPLNKSLYLPIDYLEQVTGLRISTEEIEQILGNLGFIINVRDNLIEVVPPSWRHDISILEDIIEEIIRIYGYDKIQSVKLPDLLQENANIHKYTKISNFKKILASCGYDEVVTNSFMSSEGAKLFTKLNDQLFLLNPIRINDNYMRASIVPNLLQLVQKNLARSIKDLSFFEVGPVFVDLNHEVTHLTAIITGAHTFTTPHSVGRNYDVFDIKGDLGKILDYSGLSIDKCVSVNQLAPSYYHPTRSTNIVLGKNILGYFGQIHPKILKYYDINQEVFAFELDLTKMPVSKHKSGKKTGFVTSDFQTNFRDYAFLVEKDKAVGEIISYIKNFDKKLVKSVELFDIYSGNELSNNDLKSITIKVELQANDRTLTEQELNQFSADLILAIEKKFQGKLRE